MAEFSPTELDQIEDLLEDLELNEELPLSELSQEAGARLGEYQDILRMTREALPLEEPDPGLLAGVMAEARQSAFNASATSAGIVTAPRGTGEAEDENSRPSWFSRWLPAFALAASAAGVLLWLRPESEPLPSDGPLASAMEVETVDSRTQAGADTAIPSSDAVAQAEVDEEAEDAQPDSEASEAIDPAADDGSASEGPSPASAKGSGRPTKARPPAPEESEDLAEPAVEALDKDQAWSNLTRAHQMRRRGECSSARALYGSLALEGNKNNIRAQALGGRWLCEEFAGDLTSAEAQFSNARAVWGDIDGWISAEREEMRANGHMRKKSKAAKPSPAKKKKSKSKSKSAVDASQNPFD
jgi:hypothetical protein